MDKCPTRGSLANNEQFVLSCFYGTSFRRNIRDQIEQRTTDHISFSPIRIRSLAKANVLKKKQLQGYLLLVEPSPSSTCFYRTRLWRKEWMRYVVTANAL